MDRQSLLSELVGDAFPKAVPTNRGRLRRNWVARSVDALPDENALNDVARALEANTAQAIATAYSGVATHAQLEEARPSVNLVKLDEQHVVVQIEFADSETAIGDSAMISQWATLRDLHKRLGLDELQGLPAEYWFPLR